MEDNKRFKIVGIIFYTLILIFIYWASYGNAVNNCSYFYYDESTSCVIKNIFGISDLLNISSICYFIGKNFWLILYLFLIFKLFKRKNKLSANEKKKINSKKNETMQEVKIKSSNEIQQYSLTKKEYGIILYVLIILIALVALFGYLVK